MTEFRVISGLVFAILIGAIAYDLKGMHKSWKAVFSFLAEQSRFAFGTWRVVGKEHRGMNLTLLRQVSYSLTVLLFIILGVTGFVPVIVLGDHLTGLLLVIHVTVAPLFALSLTGMSMLWAYRLQFDESDWRYLAGFRKHKMRNRDSLIRFTLKAAFWLALFFSLPLMLTVILELFPLFGTEGEEFLIRTHGYSGLLLAIVSVLNIYLTIAYTKHSNA